MSGSSSAGSSGDGSQGSGGKAKVEPPRKKKDKVLSARKLKRMQEKRELKGVIYLARVPPFMKPAKVRDLMEEFGEIGRVYLKPEDGETRAARLRAGGNRKTKYTEGWVEFEDKRIAKAVARSLNNTPIGGKKGNHWHDDVWSLKYLSKVKWDDLTAKVSYENAVRAQRMRAEVAQITRETKHYKDQVDRARMIEEMGKRRQKKGKEGKEGKNASARASGEQTVQLGDGRVEAVRRKFPQRNTGDVKQTVSGSLKAKLFGRSKAAAGVDGAPPAKKKRTA